MIAIHLEGHRSIMVVKGFGGLNKTPWKLVTAHELESMVYTEFLSHHSYNFASSWPKKRFRTSISRVESPVQIQHSDSIFYGNVLHIHYQYILRNADIHIYQLLAKRW